MPKWSEQQEKAIYTLDKNILVSASAGSGKTTVLIARLLHLVKDKKVPIDTILAMTFTEAAANEMKKRLAVSLQDAIQSSDEEEERKYLNQQLANMSKAYISTIHGFCLRIIENYYYMIGIDKKRTTNILDDATKSQLLEESMNSSLIKYKDHPLMLDVLRLFSPRADDNKPLKQSILKLFYLANSKSKPTQFLEACKGSTLTCIHDYSSDIKTYFFDYLLVQNDLILNKLEIRKQIDDGEQLPFIVEKIGSLQTGRAHLINHEYMMYKDIFFKQSIILIKKIKDIDESDILKKEIEAIESSLHSILFDEQQFISYTNNNHPILCLLCDIVLEVITQYNEKKEMIRGIDFDDMEQFALRILQASDSYIAKKYQQHFYEIMVDEFQDSNDVQAELVNLICKVNNVFRVGDIKQSIYGFRHATPAIMKSLMKNKQVHDEVIFLSSNYRSKKSIVDFNNYLYTALMNVDGFSKAFNEHDATQTGLPSQAQDNCAIELHLINDKSINEDRFDKLSKDELKSSYIVNQMLRLKSEKGYDFKDFVVLTRQNDKAFSLKKAFDDYAIPYFINMKDGFYHSRAITFVSNFLKALENPHDDLCMCALLLSPFFAFTNNDLALAKLNKGDDSFYTYFKQIGRIDSFTSLKQTLTQIQMSDLLEKIYHFNQYYFSYTSAQEKSNLDKLLELTYLQQSKQALTLPLFLEMLEKNKDTKVGEAIPIGLQDDVVRVMSIHQSKGLQFPVVFLYSRESIRIMDTSGLINYDANLHIGLHYMNQRNRILYPTIERIAINHKITKNALEEEMRILYVATTRAQNEMYIVDCAKTIDNHPLNATQLYNNSGYTKWITQAFHTPMPDLFNIYQIDALWENIALDKVDAKMHTIQSYNKKCDHLTSVAPSEKEVVSMKPSSFVLNEDTYLERGNNLHRMVEVLPNSVSASTIEQYANAHHIVLSSKDSQALLALYQNQIFINCLTKEVFHELSFMTQKDNQIIHGYMDFVSISDSSLVLIDFKSDRNVDNDILIARYQSQIDTYYEALLVMYPMHLIETYIYSFSLQRMIKIH